MAKKIEELKPALSVAGTYDPATGMEEFLVTAALSWNALMFGGANPLDQLYGQLFADQQFVKPKTTNDATVIARRSQAVTTLLQHYGFTDGFIQNVLNSGMIQNDSLFAALFVLRNNNLIEGAYTGSACNGRMTKMVSLAVAAEAKVVTRASDKPARKPARK